jgi:hypothetical protein
MSAWNRSPHGMFEDRNPKISWEEFTQRSPRALHRARRTSLTAGAASFALVTAPSRAPLKYLRLTFVL